jgi:hypothetical protein
MACDDNSAETCGGPNRLDVYSSSSGSSPTTTTASSPSATGNPLSGWTFLGCYTDNVSGRALPMMEPVSRGVTNEGCQNACLAAGYSIAGTKYAGECCKFLFLILLLLSLSDSLYLGSTPTSTKMRMSISGQARMEWNPRP